MTIYLTICMHAGASFLSGLGLFAVAGEVAELKSALERADNSRSALAPPELVKLLENRYTAVRHSALLTVFAMSNRVEPELMEQHVKCVELLLRYGARDDCRDVFGKSIVHYAVLAPEDMAPMLRAVTERWLQLTTLDYI
jgi:hypothetical protein